MIAGLSTLDAIKADAFRLKGRGAVLDVLSCLLFQRNFRPVFTLRVIQASVRAGFLGRIIAIPLKIFHRVFCWVAAIDFSHETMVGPGFCITHGWGLVVSPGAVIGANCTLFHGVTLGRKDSISEDGSRRSGFPTILDEVWIGPHAVIVGDVRIGKGARVAPGSVVIKDVPAGAIVGGNPAKILTESAMPDVFNKCEF